MQVEDTEQLIHKYFTYGFNHKEILNFLLLLHNKKISYRTLKRILAKLQLYRRKKYSNIHDVASFIECELKKSGRLHGYKWMHLRCIQNNFIVTQNIVRELLKCLDPEGVKIRSRKTLIRRQYHNQGPNFLWHMDSYDKLKPFGICINGCIDGFSRHIIWMRCGSTASDPKVIAGYFVDAMKNVGGIPKTMRCDLGTENGSVEKIQTTLHSLFNNKRTNRPCFLYGKSYHNQRIEAWWSILRKHNAQFWMNLFHMLKDEGLFDGTYLDKSLIQFCFMDLLQNELDQVVMEWNIHRISNSKDSVAPSGRPAIMYELPSIYDAENHLVDVPAFAIEALMSECLYLRYPCDVDVFNLCNFLMLEKGFIRSNDPHETVDLYISLREIIKSELN